MKKILLLITVIAAAAVSACQYESPSGVHPTLTYRVPYISMINGTACATASFSGTGYAAAVTISNSEVTTSPVFTVTIGVLGGKASNEYGNTWVGIQHLRLSDEIAGLADSSVKLRLSYALENGQGGVIRELNFASVTQSIINGMTFTFALPDTIIEAARMTLILEVIAGTPAIGAPIQTNTIYLNDGCLDVGDGLPSYYLGFQSLPRAPVSAAHHITLTVTGTRRPEASK